MCELPESIKATLEVLLQEWNLSQNLLTASPTDNVVAAMGYAYSSGIIYSILVMHCS